MATVNFVKYDSQNKTALYNVTRYVERKDKTVLDDETQLVSGQNCSPRTAYREFLATRELNDKDSPVWFYHYNRAIVYCPILVKFSNDFHAHFSHKNISAMCNTQHIRYYFNFSQISILWQSRADVSVLTVCTQGNVI